LQVSTWTTPLTRSGFVAWHILPEEVMKASPLLSHLKAEWTKHAGTNTVRQRHGGGALE